MAGNSKRSANKLSILARNEILQKGVNPIDMLLECYKENMQAFRSMRGLGDKGDAGPSYLANAGRAASELMKYYSPSLSAIAVEVVESNKDEPSNEQKVIDARRVIMSDPFAQHAIKVAEAAQLIDVDPVVPPTLAPGNKDE